MHELPVVQELIERLDKESEERGIAHISEIHLRIGELSGVVGECVQLYFDLLSEGHSSEGAKLIFTHVPVRFKCPGCGREFPHKGSFSCPECGADGVRVRGSGEDFHIVSFKGDPD